MIVVLPNLLSLEQLDKLTYTCVCQIMDSLFLVKQKNLNSLFLF